MNNMKYKKDHFKKMAKETPERDEYADLEALRECVKSFSKNMEKEITIQLLKGNKHWDNELVFTEEENLEHIKRLAENAKTANDYVDLANFAMFMWNRFDWSIHDAV